MLYAIVEDLCQSLSDNITTLNIKYRISLLSCLVSLLAAFPDQAEKLKGVKFPEHLEPVDDNLISYKEKYELLAKSFLDSLN